MSPIRTPHVTSVHSYNGIIQKVLGVLTHLKDSVNASFHIETILTDACKNRGLCQLYGGKSQRNFLLLACATWILYLASKEKGSNSPLRALTIRRSFNFCFSLQHRIFHEQVIPSHCFADFIKNATHCFGFCFLGLQERKLKVFAVFCLIHRKSITSCYWFSNSPGRRSRA